MKTIAIIGAGGNSREIADIATNLGYNVLGFLANGRGHYDSLTLGDFSWLDSNPVDCLAMGIGNPNAKLKVGSELAAKYPHIQWPVLIDPSAKVGSGCTFARGVVICVGVVVTVNVKVGQFSQLNFGCTIGHEAHIGDGCLINPGSNLSGGVEIGNRVMVGTGAQVLQYLSVGDGAIVGAGAVVTKSVEAGITVVGVPAMPIKVLA
jgi:sugar O-acyltransferase (sialic acid O-acetyltransferase NeuD family)